MEKPHYLDALDTINNLYGRGKIEDVKMFGSYSGDRNSQTYYGAVQRHMQFGFDVKPFTILATKKGCTLHFLGRKRVISGNIS